ncbi:uncharacterized protein EDB93DRAFT_933272 [Suillus bovinus]|uniref:uncharacterized protein n=1 Tax=Suillus bovinus TaxID=48563 RepID=UPI001B867E3D|nr:uncharacterized protein EDB93DRAFT_933272 [Suillus bovinus]KAG2131584.1 hypothetical protein EDB93DRAFT_933272 [Suillus bovinus]
MTNMTCAILIATSFSGPVRKETLCLFSLELLVSIAVLLRTLPIPTLFVLLYFKALYFTYVSSSVSRIHEDPLSSQRGPRIAG